MADALVVPGDAVLVRPSGVVLLRDEIGEERVDERLVAVRVDARHVDGDGVVVADVLRERLSGAAVEDDDPHGAGEAGEDVVLPALVEVQTADHAPARVREVRLPERLRQCARPRELAEPAALVLVPDELDTEQALDHRLTPPRRTKSFTS